MPVSRTRKRIHAPNFKDIHLERQLVPRWLEGIAWIAYFSTQYAIIHIGMKTGLVVVTLLALFLAMINPVTEITRDIRRDGFRKTFPITWKSGLLGVAFVIAAIGTGAAIAWSV